MGSPGLHRLEFQDVHPRAGQPPQHHSARPRAAPESALPRLGAVVLNRLQHPHHPRLQPRDQDQGRAETLRRLLLCLLQPGRRPPQQRQRRLHPPDPAQRREAAQPDRPDKRLGQ